MVLSACGAGKGRVMPLTPPSLAANYTGGYVRQQSAFTGRVSADGSTRYPAEPGRYQLYASLACPWSQRAVIVRRLLGLEQVIGLTLADPVISEHGWRFPAADGGRDHVTGASFVAELYHAADPGYGGCARCPSCGTPEPARSSVTTRHRSP